MTDVSQVSLALAYHCAGTIYPGGLAGESLTGRRTVVRRGWLLPNDMFSAQSVNGGVDYVTVSAAMEGFRPLAEPLGWPWRDGQVIAPTVGVACEGCTATVTVPASGTVCGVVGLSWRRGGVQPVVAAYAVSAGETAETVAAGLAAGLGAGAVAEGAVVTVASGDVTGQVAGYGQSVRILRRQSQKLRISIWTSSAAARDVLGSALDTALAGISWISTLDGGEAKLGFDGAGDVDTLQVQGVYRRDLVFRVDFDAIESRWAARMMFGGGTIRADGWAGVFGDSALSAAGQAGTAALAAEALAADAAAGSSPYAGYSVDAFGTVQAAQ